MPLHAVSSTPQRSAVILDPSILRAYDIRGVHQQTLTEDSAYSIGRAFATIIAERTAKAQPRIATARDGRMSSPSLSDALKEGMRDAGAVVLDAGLGPTPMLYYAAKHLEADAGIMVTGSHNPPTHNGFKMVAGPMPFFGEDIALIGERLKAGDLKSGAGSIETVSVMDDYVERLLRDFETGGRSISVVWDPGNGAAGEVVERLAAKLPGKHHTLNTTIDGSFPSHHPDPTVPENLIQLIAEVKAKHADLGVAFDGDGDRLGAVDSDGNILWGDQMMVLFSRDVLKSLPGAAIIADVKASQVLFDDIEKHGGEAIMWKTGHSLIKSKMIETKAAIAGEMSGHLFFADKYYGYDDGLYAAIRLMNLVAHSKRSLAEMRASIPAVMNTPEIRIDCDPVRKFQIVEEIRDRVKAEVASGKPYGLNEVDGVRVKYNGGWWLARASNTQSAIIVRCEASDAKTLEELKKMVEAHLAASGITVDLDHVEPAAH